MNPPAMMSEAPSQRELATIDSVARSEIARAFAGRGHPRGVDAKRLKSAGDAVPEMKSDHDHADLRCRASMTSCPACRNWCRRPRTITPPADQRTHVALYRSRSQVRHPPCDGVFVPIQRKIPSLSLPAHPDHSCR
jgi:hypothetical protein